MKIRNLVARRLVSGAFLAIAPLLSPALQAQHSKAINGDAIIDVPFAIANGHIKTPPFAVKGRPYLVDLNVKTDVSFKKWCCMIDADDAMGNGYPVCTRSRAQRLQAHWILWDGAQLVAQGPTTEHSSNCDSYIPGRKQFDLGGFKVKRGKNYVLDLELKNVDPALAISDAHLIVAPAPGMYP